MIRPIAITPGEPAGIGPDVVLQAAVQGFQYPWFAIANAELMQQRAEQLALPVNVIVIEAGQLSTLPVAAANTLYVLNQALNEPVLCGQLNAANAAYVINTLNTAIDLALAGNIAAMVTGPVHKGIINDSGLPFTGHTEHLRDRAGVDDVVMMLATEGLRVALVTTHLPLKDVAQAITETKINTVMTILHHDLQHYFGCAQPRILVTGLNPHAGEGGHLGYEEIDVIIPTLNKLRQRGINSEGPLPADTLFQPHYLNDADAVLAMYHDQGLPVLKYKGFGQAVNITLGLPFIRTSVDHGTALDLAGTGKANIGSLLTAFNTAAEMAQHRELNHA